MRYVLGIDIGTSACKASLFSEEGILCGSGRQENTMLFPQLGWAEESPDEIWHNVCLCTKQAVVAGKVKPEDIVSIAVSCAGGCIAVDEYNQPLTNFIMQMDQRSMAQTKRINELWGSEIETIGGNKIASGVSSLQTMLWLKEECPELYAKIKSFLWLNGYLVMKMTGILSGEVSRCGTSGLFDQRTQNWSEFLCDQVGISRALLPELYQSCDIVGRLTVSSAAEMGLSDKTLVAAGTLDTAAAGLGAGMFRRGDSYLVLGTFGKLCTLGSGEDFDPAFINSKYPLESLYLMLGATDGGCGLSVNWFAETFSHINATNVNKSDAYSALDKLAESVSPGCDGLLYFPWLSGEKTPNWCSDASASFVRFSRNHSFGHFYRAVLEGIAYSIRLSLQLTEARLGQKVKEIYVCGGGGNSYIWLQIIADLLDRPLIRVPDKNCEASGAAIIAARAAQLSDCLDWKPVSDLTVYPRDSYRATYDESYASFCAFSSAILSEVKLCSKESSPSE